ncbi:MAG: T9SS type A sorting domain-containing protein [Saprospiraceae bacterium]
MNWKFFTPLFALVLMVFGQLNAQRYLSPVFESVNVASDAPYGVNYTVLYYSTVGKTVPEILKMDIYAPQGDSITERPLVLLFHTGNFLPQGLNGGVTGVKTDSTPVEIATRLAKMGYVAASCDYRLGWNPLAATQEERTNTLINAAYRGVQDARTAIRFFRASYEQGNPYGIDTSKIVLWGVGTGGYITLAAATLDKYTDVLIPKFIGSDVTGDGQPDPMVIEPINGDIYGTSYGILPTTNDTFCIPNHQGYSSDFNLCVNLGGALGDTSWLDAGDPAMIGIQVPTDPFAPYKENILIVPTTGEQVVEVQGSYLAIQKADALGNNQAMIDANIDDPITQEINTRNDGLEGLCPLIGRVGEDSSPWSWWNAAYWSTVAHPFCTDPVPTCSFHTIGLQSNPDMSAEKARTYIDTIMAYFAPRAAAVLGLTTTSSVDLLTGPDVQLRISPNPATSNLRIQTGGDNPILDAAIFNLAGMQLYGKNGLNHNQIEFDRGNLPAGTYLLRLRFQQGVVTEKIVFVD